MATDMDIDMDIDIALDDVDPEIARLNAETAAIDAQADAQRAEAAKADAMVGVEEAPEEGEVDANESAPTKIHIRGLDNFKHEDANLYAGEHYSTELFKHVQWIDDTSANFVYDTEIAAEEALMAFSAVEESYPRVSRAAKSSSIHPEATLSVRQAFISDVKVKDARIYSAFYLRNEEYDPETRWKKRQFNSSDSRGAYRGQKRARRDPVEERYSRRSSLDDEPFDVDLYDDNPKAVAAVRERRASRSSTGSHSRRYVRSGVDLVKFQQNGRLRNRSASPMRDGDGRFGFAEDQPRRPTARYRSRTPPRRRDNLDMRDKLARELFPEKKTSEGALTNGHTDSDARKTPSNRASAIPAPKELFPDRASATLTTKELFPNHRRQNAKDLHPNEIAAAIGKCNLNNHHEHFTYSSPGQQPDENERQYGSKGRDLFARISGGPQVGSSYGRLQDESTIGAGTEFSIKGAGQPVDSAGFSILGAGRDNGRVTNSLVKELFPLKTGNGSGKVRGDLFEGRIKGRGSTRRRAEDLM